MNNTGQKFGGREKGTPNKSSRTLILQMQEYGMGDTKDHPVLWMYKVALGDLAVERVIDNVVIPDGVTPELRVQCMKEVAKYVSPQLKAVDHTVAGDQDSPIKHIVEYTIVSPKDTSTNTL